VERLTPFTGTAEQAMEMAMLDTDQHFVERLVGYRGNPEVRQTVEFYVEFSDGTSLWKPYDADLAQTVQFEDFCRAHPELDTLLHSARRSAAFRVAQRKVVTSVTHVKGDVVFVDLRAREIFAHEWYNALVLPDKDITFRFARMRIGNPVSKPGWKRGTRCELIDDVLHQRVHIVDSAFLHAYGQRRVEAELPPGSIVVGADFALAHPQSEAEMSRSRPARQEELLSIGVRSSSSAGVTFMSWNVNSVAAAIKKGLFSELLNLLAGPPDVLMLQEAKAHIMDEGSLERQFARLGYKHFKLLPGRPHQQAGVIIASKGPFQLLGNCAIEDGRVLAVRTNGVTGINVYCPIIWDPTYTRVKRRKEFDQDLLKMLDVWPQPHVICGDLNSVADRAMDMVVPARCGSAHIGFTSGNETHLYRALMARGYVDTYRACHPDKREYTTFPMGMFAGLLARVDYVLVSKALRTAITDCVVGPQTEVSDHAFVMATIETEKSTWTDFSALATKPSSRFNLVRKPQYTTQSVSSSALLSSGSAAVVTGANTSVAQLLRKNA